jgi:hypothetical protein
MPAVANQTAAELPIIFGASEINNHGKNTPFESEVQKKIQGETLLLFCSTPAIASSH